MRFLVQPYSFAMVFGFALVSIGTVACGVKIGEESSSADETLDTESAARSGRKALAIRLGDLPPPDSGSSSSSSASGGAGGYGTSSSGGVGGYGTSSASGGVGGYGTSSASGGVGGYGTSSASSSSGGESTTSSSSGGGESTTSSSSGGGDPDPNSLLVIVSNEALTCAAPWGSSGACSGAWQISVRIPPAQQVAGAVIDFSRDPSAAFFSVTERDCSGGGGTVDSGQLIVDRVSATQVIGRLRDVHIPLESWNPNGAFRAPRCR